MNSAGTARSSAIRTAICGWARSSSAASIKDTLSQRLARLGMNVTLIDKDLGYELRCADPIPFDAEYTRDLGYGAVKFLRSEAASHGGALISFVSGRMQPLPFEQLIDPQTGRMRPRKVDIDGEAYECARRYMIRLERADFDEPQRLAALAAAAGLDVDKFKARFLAWSNSMIPDRCRDTSLDRPMGQSVYA